MRRNLHFPLISTTALIPQVITRRLITVPSRAHLTRALHTLLITRPPTSKMELTIKRSSTKMSWSTPTITRSNTPLPLSFQILLRILPIPLLWSITTHSPLLISEKSQTTCWSSMHSCPGFTFSFCFRVSRARPFWHFLHVFLCSSI